MSKIVLITGASRGFGKIWAEAFLKRGDKVVATARNLEALKDLTEQYGDQLLPVPGLFGNPLATAEAIIKLVDVPNPPLRLLLGRFAYPAIKQEYQTRLASFKEWKGVSEATHGSN